MAIGFGANQAAQLASQQRRVPKGRRPVAFLKCREWESPPLPAKRGIAKEIRSGRYGGTEDDQGGATMSEFTPADAGRIMRNVLFDEWRGQLDSGSLTKAGLLQLRGRLDETSNEFEPGPDLELLRLQAADALAAVMGINSDELPGSSPFPNDLSGFDDDSEGQG
jgi:hypothetical protein